MTETSVPAVIAEASKTPKRSFWGYWALLFTFLVMLAATGLAVRNIKHQLKSEIKGLEARVVRAEQAADERVQSLDEDVSSAKSRIDNNLNGHQSRLTDIEARLQDHHTRLQSLTNRTLDDRLLAETLLLLRQANQRLMLERDISGAQLLLTEAEQLLNNSFAASVDPQFLILRQTLNRDLTALRLLKPVDKQGIFLQLGSLIELIPQLSTQPTFDQMAPAAPTEHIELDKNSSWRDWVSKSFGEFKAGLKNYIRLDERTDLDKPILSQETAKLVQLNLRLLLEQAQIGVLEQQPEIYQRSLNSADTLLAEYFWGADNLTQYRQSLQQLAQLDVAPPLPSVAETLKLLQSYIERKHESTTAELPKSDIARPQTATPEIATP